jgi:hypothetical protein
MTTGYVLLRTSSAYMYARPLLYDAQNCAAADMLVQQRAQTRAAVYSVQLDAHMRMLRQHHSC